MNQLVHSEAFWLALTTLAGWAANSLLTHRVAKLAPTSPWRRAIRALHGLLDAIDPKEPQ